MIWLFDIDGTLVNITPVHLATYKKMYREIARTEVSDSLLLPHFGMSEYQMHQAVFAKLGLPENLIGKMIAAHATYFSAELGTVQVLPGVHEMIAAIKKRKEHAGIITGNIKKNAELILKKAHLSFEFMATDDGKKVRWEILMDAIEKGKKLGSGRIIVVGDTTSDIEAVRECSRKTGERIVSIAVATGTCTLSQLKAADLVLPSMDASTVVKVVG